MRSDSTKLLGYNKIDSSWTRLDELMKGYKSKLVAVIPKYQGLYTTTNQKTQNMWEWQQEKLHIVEICTLMHHFEYIEIVLIAFISTLLL